MAESALDIYRRTLGDVQRINSGYGAAMDEQRQAYDTSMSDLSGAYANQDKGAPLYALASGLLAPTRTGRFGESVGAGLTAYSAARDRESQRDIERASKIAALRDARAKLSQQALDSQRQMLPTQTGIASGIHGIEQHNLAEKLRQEQAARTRQLLESLGVGASATPAPAPAPAGNGGFEGDPSMMPGQFGQEGDEGQPAQAPPTPRPPALQPVPAGSPRPQPPVGNAPRPAIELTPAQKMLLAAADPKEVPTMLAGFLKQNDVDMSPEGKKARDLGFKPGTPEFYDVVRKIMAGEYKPSGTSDTGEERDKLAAGMGLPKMTIDPTAGLTPANSERMRLQLMKDSEKQATTASTSADTARSENAQLDRFLKLNQENTRTGPVMGMLPNLSDTAKEMESISADMARHQRQPGEGAVSDFDAKQFKLIVPSTSNSPETNRKLAMARQAANKAQMEKAEFLRAYQTAYGHLHGADYAWMQYANDNPIFSREKQGEINDKRADWRSYFSKQRSGGSSVDAAMKIIDGK